MWVPGYKGMQGKLYSCVVYQKTSEKKNFETGNETTLGRNGLIHQAQTSNGVYKLFTKESRTVSRSLYKKYLAPYQFSH